MNIGIIQMQAKPLKVEENLALAENLIMLAAKDGAQLVVLPEMFNVGYYLGEDLMKVAETLEKGKTVTWLKEQAARYGISIIAGLYERYAKHFYDTMVMVGCDETIQYYRKRNPALSEAAAWRRGPLPGPGIFDSPLCRVGGAICFDSFVTETFQGFKQNEVDLVVVIAGWGMPSPVGKRFDLRFLDPFLRLGQSLASELMPYQYATRLGIPVAYVNQGGMTKTPVPLPSRYPWSASQMEYNFHGNSQVRDARGNVLVRAGSTETAYYAVVPIEIRPAKQRPEIQRIDIPPRYLSPDYYFVQPPMRSKLIYFLGTLLQAWSFRDLQMEYEARRTRYEDRCRFPVQ